MTHGLVFCPLLGVSTTNNRFGLYNIALSDTCELPPLVFCQFLFVGLWLHVFS